MFRPGPRNLITDVAGLRVGHATDEQVRSGVTAVVCGAAWSAGVDVRGGGPGGRETDALSPENLVGRAHAVVLAGGSVFGLAAADGVAAALSARGVGLQLRRGSPHIPIVPSAVLHDLGNGGDKHWGLAPPYRDLGLRALDAAAADFALGSVGAGRGAMAGLIKGGIGSTSLDLGEGLIVGALVALNSVGSALMPDGKTFWAWAFEIDREFGGSGPPSSMDSSDPAPDASRLLALGRLQAGREHHAGRGGVQRRPDHGGMQARGHDGAGRNCTRRAAGSHAVRRRHDIRPGERRGGPGSRVSARRPHRAHRFGGRGLPGARHWPRCVLPIAASLP